MSTETQTIPDDIARFVEAIFADPSNFLTEEAAKAVVARTMSAAVMAERGRCEAVCTDHISIFRKIFQNDVARAIEQVRAEIKAVSA
ncbi:hypothetical protein [Shinella sp. DD12]|uniref:hypothetical protein n=1 Tax=Shinella sp. DD12 TaxID=1410620 RepID=UPI000437A04A|nr:hypothetical protein [Shinella sp. DD12]EYR81422.1 hypothetical protein SHLA_15c001070 [Shinella sp. DD12]